MPSACSRVEARFRSPSPLRSPLLRARLARGVVVGRRARGAFHANARWRSSQPLDGRLRGGFGLVSIRIQDDPGFYRTAVAFKNKPAPDDRVPAWIFSEPITIIALWLPHRRNMTCRVANFQAGWSPTDSNGTPVPLWPDDSTPCLRRLELISSNLFLRAKPFRRRLAIAGRCAPRRCARSDGASRIARAQDGAYPCILGVPRMRLTAGRAMHRNRHARKTFEQNPLAAQPR